MSEKLRQARRGLMAIRLEVDQSIADDLTNLVEDAIAELIAESAELREALGGALDDHWGEITVEDEVWERWQDLIEASHGTTLAKPDESA